MVSVWTNFTKIKCRQLYIFPKVIKLKERSSSFRMTGAEVGSDAKCLASFSQSKKDDLTLSMVYTLHCVGWYLYFLPQSNTSQAQASQSQVKPWRRNGLARAYWTLITNRFEAALMWLHRHIEGRLVWSAHRTGRPRPSYIAGISCQQSAVIIIFWQTPFSAISRGRVGLIRWAPNESSVLGLIKSALKVFPAGDEEESGTAWRCLHEAMFTSTRSP